MNGNAHILIITMNDYNESSSTSISVEAFMDEAIEAQGGRDTWALLTVISGGGEHKQIDSDMIREYRAMSGLDDAMAQWLSDEANRVRLALEAFYGDEGFAEWDVDAAAVQAAYELANQ